MEKLKLYYPLDIWHVTQGFGENQLPLYKELGLKGHNGQDASCADGAVVRAAHDGEVTYAGEDGAGGVTVVVRTLEKFEYLNKSVYFKTIYAHLKKGSFKVKPGQKVKTGEVLAQADNTGASTGTHLHLGCKPVYKGEKDWQWYNLEPANGYNGALNPAPYFTGIYAKDRLKLNLLTAMVELYKKIISELQKPKP